MELNFKDALVFTGGGTGGHYYPALALAEEVKARWPGRAVIFVGARNGIESRELPETDWPHLLMNVTSLQGGMMSKFRAVFRAYSAWRQLKKKWEKQMPFAVIGTGGYASAPSFLAAKSLKIPYYIHESNAEPGLVVKITAKNAKRVWLGMKTAATRLQNAQCLYVGTPVRKSFLRPFKPYSDLQSPYILLVLGGSGGARAINNAMISIGGALLKKHQEWKILHQAGVEKVKHLNDLPLHPRHCVVPYIENMDSAMEDASLVLTRAGASTCSELKTVGRPAVLVPYPHAASNHQKHNAMAFENEARGVMLEQGQSFEHRLFDALSRLMERQSLRDVLATPEQNNAVSRCIDDISLCIEKGSTL